MMNEAHVFQHQYTGVQIFVYHVKNKESAILDLSHVVCEPTDWTYLGRKVATDVN